MERNTFTHIFISPHLFSYFSNISIYLNINKNSLLISTLRRDRDDLTLRYYLAKKTIKGVFYRLVHNYLDMLHLDLFDDDIKNMENFKLNE